MTRSVLLFLVACIYIASAFAETQQIALRVPRHRGRWLLVGDAPKTHPITFKILLKQQNLEKLDKIFWEVSDPRSESYGKFLSQKQLHELVAAAPEDKTIVLQWLQESGIPSASIAVYADFIKVATTTDKASTLFNTQFSVYKSYKSGLKRTRINGGAHIPTRLASAIDFVTGLSELIDDTRIKPKSYDAPVSPVGDDGFITPSVLLSYYSVPAGQVGGAQGNMQGIAAFDDYFSQGALAQFDSMYGITGVNITRSGPDCFPDNCDQYESDLDAQYMTAMGRNVDTLFLAHGDGEWILDWAQQLATMSNPPLINSISYGWAELEQCEITSGCSTYGYDSVAYVTRTNQEIQKLGTLGLTVLVSDGDDGAPSLGGASGNCPLDMSTYCPTGGCQHTRSLCTEITFTLESNNTNCYFPMGIGSDACAVVLQDQSINAALQSWAEHNSKCQVAIEYDRTQDPHLYSSCECSQLEAHSSHGINIQAYTFDENNGAVFAADYPTSSPYVTSVGATQFFWRNGKITSELGASILTGAKITTGGGFSSFQAQPSYQNAAIASYIKSGVGLPPSFSYNATMRGYPDIVFNGHNYIIYASNSTSDLDECPCTNLPVDGTSCSSPSLAGLLSLINDQLLSKGKSPLGFINPLLYQMSAAHPQAYNDITSGDNTCNRSYCCKYGYTATSGWDPVGGLGSPVFSEFQDYILSVKGVKKM